MFSATAARILAAAAFTVTASIGPGLAYAAPFDVQPAPAICPGGMGVADATPLPGGRLAISVDEPPPAGGGRVVWVNNSTGANGIATLTNTGSRAEFVAATGPGVVTTVLDGVYTNGAGQPCVLAQGGVATTVVT
ncbi:amidohydrolase [Prescottella equi]|uniref:amidohydrolase n=1 Tax=Rhodococcus hoagii TaxID=43767 RepID=UPI000D0FD05A|nr:amidohydrolase [Prescottella equi]AVP68198.1 amidohydrolase [Prescottella equi]